MPPAGVRALGASFALQWLCVALVAGPGSAALVELTGRLDTSGLFVALYFVAAALAGALGGRALDRWGRRPVLAAGHATGAVGFAVAGWGVHTASLPLFLLGTVELAFGAGIVFLTRLAASELYPPAQRAQGVAYVQRAATVGAVAGPVLLFLVAPAAARIGLDPWTALWWVAPPLLLVGAFLVTRAPEPPRRATPAPDAPVAAAPGRRPGLGTATLGLALAHASMVMVMGVAGALLVNQGYGLTAVGSVIGVHFLGMFVLSTHVGRVANRYGRRTTMLAGFALTATGATLLASVPGLVAFTLALFLVGLGWSFSYIAGTVMIADVAPPLAAGRLLGNADRTAALMAALAATAGGYAYAAYGPAALGVFAVMLVIIPALVAWTLTESTPGVYGTDPVPAPAPA